MRVRHVGIRARKATVGPDRSLILPGAVPSTHKEQRAFFRPLIRLVAYNLARKKIFAKMPVSISTLFVLAFVSSSFFVKIMCAYCITLARIRVGKQPGGPSLGPGLSREQRMDTVV